MDIMDRRPLRLARASPGRLVLELRPGQALLVNGALLQVRARCSIVLCNRARFLFGRQVMEASDATTPARRLYLALQGAYAGVEEERAAQAEEARRLAAEQTDTRPPESRAVLRAALVELDTGREREALLMVRRLFAEDDAGAADRPAA